MGDVKVAVKVSKTAEVLGQNQDLLNELSRQIYRVRNLRNRISGEPEEADEPKKAYEPATLIDVLEHQKSQLHSLNSYLDSLINEIENNI